MAEDRRRLGRIRGRLGLCQFHRRSYRACFGTAGSNAGGFNLLLFSLQNRRKGYESSEIACEFGRGFCDLFRETFVVGVC